MESALIAVALANAALLVVVLVVLLRRASDAATSAEAQRVLREQVTDAARLVGEMRQQLTEATWDARQESERNRREMAEKQSENLKALQEQLDRTVRLTQERLDEVRSSLGQNVKGLTDSVTTQLSTSAKAIGEVKQQLGSLAETAKSMREVGRDIASLQDILRAPKLRGNLGELFLEELLKQVLPANAYAMQQTLPGAEAGTSVKVDAVVRVGDRLVPIDSKFPLESFQRLHAAQTDEDRTKHRKAFVDSVKRRVDEIAERYIRPDAGTYEFALMYLPAENVYYEAVIRDDVADGVVSYAAQKRVIPVSPNTLYAYLLTIAYGLKGLQIERQAEAIRGQLAAVQKKFAKFYEVFEKVGRNIELAHKHHDDAARRALALNDQVSKITGTVLEIEEGASASSRQPELPEP